MRHVKSLLRIIEADTVAHEREIGRYFSLTKASKLTDGPKNAFSLPAGVTCPGKTRCKLNGCADCYAKGGNHRFARVMRAHVRNFLTLEEYRARGDAAGCARVLAGKIIGECVPCFRVHESGDFYSEFQIDVWARVARALPEIKFWAYTRTYWLNYGPLVELPNWQHYFSIDDDNFEAVLKTRASLSYGHKIKLAEISPTGIDSAKYITRSTGFTCPAGKGQALDGVPGACLRCKLCWSGKCRKSPVFIKH